MTIKQTPKINKIYIMTEFDLLRTNITMGNMYMCLDTQVLWYDETDQSRAVYNYVGVRTVNDLQYNITPVLNTTYYCWEDNSLWLWMNKWITLYSDVTYPSAYVYDDNNNLNSIYRNDMPNFPADDNGLLKDGSVVVRDRNRIIKGKMYINDENDYLVFSSFLGGGIRFLPNGLQSTEGEWIIGDNGKSYIRSEFHVLNDEVYVDYSEEPQADKSEYPTSSHIYKVYHEGNLDVSAIKVLTPEQLYAKLQDPSLPEELNLNVTRFGGHSVDEFSFVGHKHLASEITDFVESVKTQADLSIKSVFNTASNKGITSTYNTATSTLSLIANEFAITLVGGVAGNARVTNLSDVTIDTIVDPTAHKHVQYEEKLQSLQNQINALAPVETPYTNKEIDDKIALVTGTYTPTAGKPLLVDNDLSLHANAISSSKLDHNISLKLIGDISGTITFTGEEKELQLDTLFDTQSPTISKIVDTKFADKYFTTLIGDGESSSVLVRHNLGSENIIVQFRSVATGEELKIANTMLDENRIRVDCSSVIDTDSIKVLIYKLD